MEAIYRGLAVGGNYHGLCYHMHYNDRDNMINDLEECLENSINDDEAYSGFYQLLMQFIEYSDKFLYSDDEKKRNQRMLKIKEKVEHQRAEIEAKRKQKNTIKEMMNNLYSLTNFNEVIEIINIYQKNNINEDISGAINGKMYTIAKNGNSIMISCDGKKGLCINFNVTPDFIATLSFTYINTQTCDNQAFSATLNGWSYNSIKGNAATVLSKSLIPITSDGRPSSWKEASKHQEDIMDNSELQAVISILIDYTNSDKAEKQDTATI